MMLWKFSETVFLLQYGCIFLHAAWIMRLYNIPKWSLLRSLSRWKNQTAMTPTSICLIKIQYLINLIHRDESCLNSIIGPRTHSCEKWIKRIKNESNALVVKVLATWLMTHQWWGFGSFLKWFISCYITAFYLTLFHTISKWTCLARIL